VTKAKLVKVKSGCFVLRKGFPDEYYGFTGGELSATVERNGGINNLKCLDVFKFKGKFYPDFYPTPIIFQKEGNQCGKRPLYGPAVQFISTNLQPNGRKGRNLFHCPDFVELYPFGFRSRSERFGHQTSYDMIIAERNVLFAFSNHFPTRRDFVICIDKNHIFQGETSTFKSFPPEDQIPNFPGKPNGAFPSHCVQKWDFIGYDNDANAFVMEGVMNFSYGQKGMVVFIAADRRLRLIDTKYRYLLVSSWGRNKKLKACMVMAESRAEARKRTGYVLGHADKMISDKIRINTQYSQKTPELKSGQYPEIHALSRTAPSFLKAMIIVEDEREACIRAATYHYCFFAGWDQIWPAKAFTLMGDWELAKKILRYQAILPMKPIELGNIAIIRDIAIIHLINTVENFISVSGDRIFMNEMYPLLKDFWFTMLSRVSNVNGFISGGGCSVDDPKEVEQTGEMWCPDTNGWWHGACRAMENMAYIAGDGATAAKAGEIAKQIEKNYLNFFYNSEAGYLYIAVDVKTRKGIPIYHNVMTLAMDYPYGEYLLYPVMRELAEFQAYELYHPAGRSAVPYWDRADEMWHNGIMFQHIAHEMRVARTAGLDDEIDRMMKVYLQLFNTYKTVRETHNLTGCDGDIALRADWQAFGTRALYSGVFEGLLGIQCDLGGFQYVPCETQDQASVEGFRFRNGKWNITLKGRGPYVKQISIDGNPVKGTLKVPLTFLNDRRTHKLLIERSGAPFKRPTLLSAPGAYLKRVESDEKKLLIEVAGEAHVNWKIFCPFRPSIAYGGKEMGYQWYPKNNIAWVSGVFKPDKELVIHCF
jgi:hypothetical protein